MSRTARIDVTPKGQRYVSLMKLDDAALHCIGTVYVKLGLMQPHPDFLFDRSAVIAAIVAAEQGRMRPTLTVIPGGKAA